MVDAVKRSKLCRTCLKEVEEGFEIFQMTVSIATETYLLKDMFLSCLSAPLLEDDALSKIICRICLKRLYNAYTFKQQCDQSYFHLMNQLHSEACPDNLVTITPVENCEFELQSVDNIVDTNLISKNDSSDLDIIQEYDVEDFKETDQRVEIRNDKLSEPTYSCVKCTKEFTTKKLLNKHVLSHKRTTVEVKLCPICGKAFKFTSGLETHMRHHSREKTVECAICTKRFMDKNKLNVHMRIHSGEKPYICQVCGKTFTQYGVLKTHLTLHIGRPVTCSICKQGFSRKSQLTIHMRRHTGERPFICDECGKGFIMKSHLKEHSVLHSRETPYICKECGCTFKQVCTLRMHEKTHLSTAPYNCAVCNLSFLRHDHYSQHMELHLEV